MVMKIRVASLGAVKPILGSKVPSLETLLPDMEKKSSGFSFPMMERDISKSASEFHFMSINYVTKKNCYRLSI